MTKARTNILLVDDDQQARLKIARALESHGHTVTAVDGGRVALARLAEEAFDLILLDILMPEVDGFEVLRTIKSDSQLVDIPVIVVSALDDEKSEENSKKLGARAYLTKPIIAEDLNARVNECLNLRI